MKKEGFFAIMVVALVALFFSAVPIVADAGDNPLVDTFEGTRCRCDFFGSVITYPDGRMKIKDQEALWSIDVDHPLVQGNWWNDMMMNRTAPPDFDAMLHGKFEIFPDILCDGDMINTDGVCADECSGPYKGYWKGVWLLLVKDGIAKFSSGQGKGMGALEGLEIKWNLHNPTPNPQGVDCSAGGSMTFDGRILVTPSADGG